MVWEGHCDFLNKDSILNFSMGLKTVMPALCLKQGCYEATITLRMPHSKRRDV